MPNPAARNAASTSVSLQGMADYLLATWHDVMRREDVGPAVKLAYLWLWLFAGAKDGTITITAKDFAGHFGDEGRTAKGWLNTLESAKWIKVHHRDKKSGQIDLYVEPPEGLDRPRRFAGDPHRYFAWAEEPAPEMDRESGDPPEVTPGALRAETPTPQVVESQGDAAIAGGQVGVSAREAPPSLMNHGSKAQIQSLQHRGASEGSMKGSEEKEPHDCRDERWDTRNRRGPKNYATCLNESLLKERCEPGTQKRRLVVQIQEVCDSDTDPSIPGRAADLVVYDHVPEKELLDIIDKVAEARRRGKIKTSSGALLLWLVRKLAKKYDSKRFEPHSPAPEP